MQRRLTHAGFTLVEAIVVIAIIGIIGAIVAVFIRLPVQNYADSVARAEVTDEADLALRRMAREIRLALPNSVRVIDDNSGSAIEFLLTKTGGRYLSSDDPNPNSLPPLDFSNTANTSLTVVGTLTQPVAVNDYFVVYNLGSGMAPSDAWGSPTGGSNIAQVSAVTGTVWPTLTLKSNPFAAQNPPMPSPGNRFQIVSGPVMFACAPAGDGALVLTRYSGYSINATMSTPPTNATSAAPLSRRVSSCKGLFTYDTSAGAAQRTSLVSLAIELAARTTAGTAATSTIRLVRQVHVDNTP